MNIAFVYEVIKDLETTLTKINMHDNEDILIHTKTNHAFEKRFLDYVIQKPISNLEDLKSIKDFQIM